MSGDGHTNETRELNLDAHETHDGAACLVCRTFLGIAPVHPRVFAELHRPGEFPER